ncbi:ketoacyl-ACP synthase III [bacterium]|nr:ketoacyl-ACP synthase III [bacterium]
MKQFSSIKIAGTGSFLPDKIVTNADLEKIVDTSDEWIVTRSGIKERRIAENGVTTSYMSSKAALRAIDAAGLKPSDIQMIIVATVTPDHLFPATACLVQEAIGANNAAAFDLSAACSGFVSALSVGSSFIESGLYDNVLIIGADTLSKITDWQDRSTCVLFGDGAGATVLRRSDKGSRILYQTMGSDGSGSDLLVVPAGGSGMPASEETVKNRDHFIKMKGNELFKWAVKKMKDLISDAIEATNISVDDIKYIVSHQVNIRIISAALKRLEIPLEKVEINLDKYGNTSSASVPIALDELVRRNVIKKGDKVLMVAFGSGLTWATFLIEW